MGCCVLRFPGRTGLTNGYKKGVGNLFLCLILMQGLGVPNSTDKTTAPHRERYIAYQSRQDGICLRCRCYCHISSWNYKKPPSFCIMKIMKITPFRVLPRWGEAAHCPVLGLPVRHECRGGVSPDICTLIAQGTVQLYATASHRLE